jgi:indole-3-glycerol phosphate synthase
MTLEIRRLNPAPAVHVENLKYQVKVANSDPNHILEEIVWHKEREVEIMREKLPLLELRKQVLKADPARDFLGALKNGKTKPALIAEVKKASPSKGVIRENFNPVEIAKSYQEHKASCISVLTDQKFFQGSFENLALVRQAVDLPLLCKEFIVYPYQIYYGRAKGADAVLLIAAILRDQDLQYFIKIIDSLGMTALIEVHTLAELDRVLALDGVKLIGINNRDLHNFSVTLETTTKLLEKRREIIQEKGILIVSESGLNTAEDLELVANSGAEAVLIGEALVKQTNCGEAIANLFK